MKTLFLILILSASAMAQEPPPQDINSRIDYNTKKFRYILETSAKNHLDSLDIDKISEAAFKSMLKSMDSQSDYFSAKQLKEIQEKNTGTIEGVGLQVIVVNDSAVVGSVAKNSPADSAAIKRGDIILFIDDKPLKSMQSSDITAMLNGTPGTSVNLIVKSYASGELKNILLKRSAVHTSGVNTAFIVPNTKVGCIYSARFTENIEEEIVSAISKLISRGANSIILDLRGNPGGYLEQVTKLLEEFLPEGKVLTYTESRNPEYSRTFKTTRKGKFCDLPIVVLIDEQSASASEIFAGAMQDLDRGIVVGTNSFGKGTIQRMWNINDGSGFRLTVGQYHTPLGRCIDKHISSQNAGENTLDESLKLQIGEEAYSNLLEAMSKAGSKTSVPVYRTAKNRVVFGGGGILPDVRASLDTTTLLSKVLTSRGIFFEFALNYFKQNEHSLKNNYKNIEEYLNNFDISNEIFDKFVKFSYSKNIWNEAMAAADRQHIKNMIKVYVAHFIWDDFGFQAAKIYNDNVFEKGLEEIEKAKLLLN